VVKHINASRIGLPLCAPEERASIFSQARYSSQISAPFPTEIQDFFGRAAAAGAAAASANKK